LAPTYVNISGREEEKKQQPILLVKSFLFGLHNYKCCSEAPSRVSYPNFSYLLSKQTKKTMVAGANLNYFMTTPRH